MFIDTEGTFRPKRIIEIAEEMELDSAAVLENITYTRAMTSDQQMHMIQKAAAMVMSEDDVPYRLIVVDSIIALFRADYSGTSKKNLVLAPTYYHHVRTFV